MATLSVQQTPTDVNTPNEEPPPVVCALGNPLDDCAARRAGCGSHFEMLKFMYPPLQARSFIAAQMGNDPEVRAWLARLDSVLPGLRSRVGWWR